MISGELWREAEAHGVATSYRDWHGRRAEVGEETLRAVLAAMGETPRRNAGAAARRPLAAHLSRAPGRAAAVRPELGVHGPAVLAAFPPVVGPW